MPAQFWELTPRELILQQRGFMWRQEQEDWRMANIIATMRNPQPRTQSDPKRIKRSHYVTAADVLGKTKRQTQKTGDPYAHKRMLDGLVSKTKHWKPRERKREPNPS